MDNEDIVEMKSHQGGESSRTVNDDIKIPIMEPTNEVQEHGQYLSKNTYDSIKHNKSESYWKEIGDDILSQESPMKNTVLHIAALFGNDNCAKNVIQKAPHLLDAKNKNGDTALHVAARAGRVSTLEVLLVACLRNLAHRYSEKPKEALDKILVENEQGNTFFHEAILNNHAGVMNILGSVEEQIEFGFRELVERFALLYMNNEEKSVFHLAIEKDLVDIVDKALAKFTSEHPALDTLIQNNQELAKMLLPTPSEQGKVI
ncbi:Protein ACCELERATED CELL DEATH 6, partial [Mucuna pruriens]